MSSSRDFSRASRGISQWKFSDKRINNSQTTYSVFLCKFAFQYVIEKYRNSIENCFAHWILWRTLYLEYIFFYNLIIFYTLFYIFEYIYYIWVFYIFFCIFDRYILYEYFIILFIYFSTLVSIEKFIILYNPPKLLCKLVFRHLAMEKNRTLSWKLFYVHWTS